MPICIFRHDKFWRCFLAIPLAPQVHPLQYQEFGQISANSPTFWLFPYNDYQVNSQNFYCQSYAWIPWIHKTKYQWVVTFTVFVNSFDTWIHTTENTRTLTTTPSSDTSSPKSSSVAACLPCNKILRFHCQEGWRENIETMHQRRDNFAGKSPSIKVCLFIKAQTWFVRCHQIGYQRTREENPPWMVPPAADHDFRGELIFLAIFFLQKIHFYDCSLLVYRWNWWIKSFAKNNHWELSLFCKFVYFCNYFCAFHYILPVSPPKYTIIL